MNYRRSHLFKGTINKKYIFREFKISLSGIAMLKTHAQPREACRFSQHC